MARKIIVIPHDPHWSVLFQREADRLVQIMEVEIVAIHHFGSTAIPHIYAKPIIDILIEVHEIERVDELNEKMIGLGYLPKGEFGISGRRFFIKGDEENRTHHLHFYRTGHPEVERHLVFRDYMIVHPQEAEAYSRLKIELAQLFPTDIDGYNAGKTGFIKEIDRKAKAWRMNGK
jgi:GrpB-like predicted nucleotidyltransferase (UPF0157 family)